MVFFEPGSRIDDIPADLRFEIVQRIEAAFCA
jgi:hypothetical protein